jgi:predicted GTPase
VTGRAAGADRIVIPGAAGRDFHNFNVVYRDDPTTTVVAFTATQIPGIAGRRYPPRGVARARRRRRLVLLGPERTMLRAAVPVVAVSAVRTGCGKSPIARWLGARLRARGRRVAVLRHPMPYSDLERQRAQRFEKIAALDAAGCTVEEREEYEPHLAAGNVVFAGVDYARIASQAAAGADVIVWDGGNNDFPFLRPDLHLVVVDALRPDDAHGYHPGEAVLQTADLVVVNKVDATARGPAAHAGPSERRRRHRRDPGRSGACEGPVRPCVPITIRSMAEEPDRARAALAWPRRRLRGRRYQRRPRAALGRRGHLGRQRGRRGARCGRHHPARGAAGRLARGSSRAGARSAAS